MDSGKLSRRGFARIAGGLAAAGLPVYGAAPTAEQVLKQIREALGGEWPANGVDGLKAGNPETPIKGIATTAMATVEVLRQAAKAGTNLVISYEPTFFGSRDVIAAPPVPGQQPAGRGGFGSALNADDPVYKAKKELIEKNNLVVFRLRDHWRTKEGQMVNGLADSLGWASRRVPGDLAIYEVPSATLADTVASVKKKLNLRGGLRAVGDPKTKISRVMLCPGSIAIDVMWSHYEKVDLLLAGEIREWECSPYAADVITAGQKRGLVAVGRVVSEDPGMRACAAWLKTVVKDMPVQFIPAGDPYWRAV